MVSTWNWDSNNMVLFMFGNVWKVIRCYGISVISFLFGWFELYWKEKMDLWKCSTIGICIGTLKLNGFVVVKK